MHCVFCGSALYLDLESITRVMSIPIHISADEAPLFVRRHLKSVAFDERISIVSRELLLIPFWRDREKKWMARASGEYSEPKTMMPAVQPEGFFPERLPPEAEILPVTTRPLDELNLLLYYLPFFKMTVSLGEQKFRLLCNAVTGEVTGEQIPVETGPHIFRVFRTFLLIFFAMLAVDFLVDNNWILLVLNGVCLFLAQQLSIPMIEKWLYK